MALEVLKGGPLTESRLPRTNLLKKRICSVKLGLSPKVAPQDLEGYMWPGERRFPTPALEAPGHSPGGCLETWT